MRHGKKLLAVVLCTFYALMAAACSSAVIQQEEKNTSSNRKIKIGMSFDSYVIERWERDRDVFVSVAKQYGAEVNVQNANGNLDEQRKQIEYLINKGMDVIVIICIDSNGLSDIVNKAHDAGIKIIAYDRLINNANVDLYITFDNERVGTLMGEALVSAGVVNGQILMLGGSPTDSNVKYVEDGFKRIMEENGNTILDSVHADGWRAEAAAEYIYSHEDIVAGADAIMCGNDNLAGQALHALSETRMAGDIFVVGQDAELEACQHVVEGTQLMTVYKPVEKLAEKAAECAIALAGNRDLPYTNIGEIDDGTYLVPYIGMEPIGVNSKNMDDVIINSGFHLREDVYLHSDIAE